MGSPRFGVVVFPGSNCERDVLYVLTEVLEVRAELVWHGSRKLGAHDALILPGGFSYGDYLRAGAIARFAPIMEVLPEFVERQGLVLGICNGFQVLVEAGLLPGAMVRNTVIRYVCRWTTVRVENNRTPFTLKYEPGECLRIPIAHAEGNYYIEPSELQGLARTNRVAFRFCDPKGRATPEANPNGSVDNITGVFSPNFRVLGMMPHPERASESILGGTDGLRVFLSMLEYLGAPRRPARTRIGLIRPI